MHHGLHVLVHARKVSVGCASCGARVGCACRKAHVGAEASSSSTSGGGLGIGTVLAIGLGAVGFLYLATRAPGEGPHRSSEKIHASIWTEKAAHGAPVDASWMDAGQRLHGITSGQAAEFQRLAMERTGGESRVSRQGWVNVYLSASPGLKEAMLHASVT
jgi:hypothetical protein